MRKVLRWRRQRRFEKAYRILRKESDRHKKADHMMEFHAVNSSLIIMRCTGCPELHP